MLAEPDGHGAGDRVLVVGRADGDRVDILLFFEHDAEIVVLGRLGMPVERIAGRVFIDIAQGNNVLRSWDVAEIAAPLTAGADDADVEPVIRPRPASLNRLHLTHPEAGLGDKHAGPSQRARFQKITTIAASSHGEYSLL